MHRHKHAHAHTRQRHLLRTWDPSLKVRDKCLPRSCLDLADNRWLKRWLPLWWHSWRSERRWKPSQVCGSIAACWLRLTTVLSWSFGPCPCPSLVTLKHRSHFPFLRKPLGSVLKRFLVFVECSTHCDGASPHPVAITELAEAMRRRWSDEDGEI